MFIIVRPLQIKLNKSYITIVTLTMSTGKPLSKCIEQNLDLCTSS